MCQSTRSLFFVLLWLVVSSLFAANAANAAPAITSPTVNSTLPGVSQTFTWDAGGSEVTQWWLYVGSSKGGTQYYNSGNVGTATSKTVTLPADGSAIYVRLWYYLNGGWGYADSTYTAAKLANSGLPQILSPQAGAQLSGSSSLISWTSNSTAVTSWWIYAGNSLGSASYFNSGSISAATTSKTITGLPADGSTVYIRLWYYMGGWKSVDGTYKAVSPIVNHIPEITGTPATTVNVGESYNFTPTASDEDDDTKTFAITNKPAWAEFDETTGVLSGTPAGTDVGTSAGIVISVTDGKSTPVSLAAFNIEVIQPNRAPAIEGTPATAVNVGEGYSFTPTASDEDGDTKTFAITNKPAWAEFDETTGVLSGTPAGTDVGTSEGIVISVTDGKSTPVSLAAFNIEVIQPNRAPTLEGTPATAVNAGTSYNFIPTASDADNDTLTFSIANKPAWATFDTATGALTGTPAATDAGTTSDIAITVTDSKAEAVSLSAFAITVTAPVNLARQYGVATQSTTYSSSYPASNVIDGNASNFNHTNKSTGGDWWQVKLPATASLSSIVVKNRNSTSNYGRLAGATVYVSNQPATVGINEADKVATLEGIATNTITLNPQRQGMYVIVKAGSSYLHMAEVEVFGFASAAPAFEQPAYNFNLNYKAAQGAAVGTTKAGDFQADALTYSIDGNVPFAIDTQGNISLMGTLKEQSYSFNVKVSDGANTTSVPVTVATPINFAREFGIATEGGTYTASRLASLTIDGNTTTANHTSCDARNWWQVSLPNPMQINKIVVKNATSWQGRLNGAVVYVTDAPYTVAVPTDANKVSTLTGSSADQIITFATPKTGSYVIVKNAGVECLHMAEVEVYGQAPATPAFAQASYPFYLSEKAAIGAAVGTTKAVDYQFDALAYSIEGNVPFAVDAQGKLTLTGALNHNLTQRYDFKVLASDGVNSTSTNVAVVLGKGNGAWLQRWEGISGSSVDSLLQAAHYKNDMPDYAGSAAALDVKSISKDNYGQKLTAYLVPAVSGNYQFAIVGDDASQLKLSPTTDAGQASKIAENGYGAYQDWNAAGKSAVIALEAGKSYYIEVLHKEGGGGDYISVGWKREGETSFTLVPSNQLYQDALSVGLVKPAFAATALDLRLEPNTPVNTVIGKAPASDPQGDTLTYRIAESVPFAVDAQGSISVTQAINHNALPSYAFTVKVADGVYEATLPVTVTMGKGVGVLLQRWDGITGSSISALTSSAHYQNDAPDYAATLGNFTAPDSGKDNFGQRLTGFIKPTQSGKYQFAIIGDDNTQLRLSTNAVLEGAPVIASQNSWGNYQEWASAGVSALIDLEAGQVYALEALHKEGGGADHVSVAWKRQGDSDFSSLPADAVYQDALSAGVAQPFFTAHQARYLLPWNVGMGTQVAQIQAIDPQGDVLTYVLSGSDAFAVDATGNVTLSGSIQPNTDYALTLTVNDGVFSVATNIVVHTNSDQAVQEAIQSGNADAVTTDELLDTAIAKIQANKDSCQATVSGLYPNGLDTAAFPSRSAYFKTTTQRNMPLHVSNDRNPPKVYSWIGAKESGARYAVLGTDVFSFSGVNVALKDNTLNVLNWLLKQSGSTDILNQPLTLLVPDYWDREGLKTWVAANGLTHQWTIASDANLLNTGAFDVYLGSFSQPLNHIQSVLAQGKPIAMFNSWYEPSADRLAEFGLAWEWYGAAAIGNLESVDDLCNRTNPYSQVQTTLKSLKNGLPDFIYEASDCPVSDGGNTNCDETRVTDAAGNSIATLFNNGASVLRSQIAALDAKGINAFNGSNEDVLKLAILLGDKYRAAARFPMDKETTDDTAFFRSLFADFTVHYSRPNNAYQPDMGRFTTGQAALHNAETLSKSLTYTPTTFGEWTSTGLYVPPGKTITVRRTDSSTSKAKLRFNMLGDSMVHIWEPNAYNRPRYLSSTVLTLEVGKTYTLSTPRGGPVYIGWEGVASGATPFTVEINGVLENPLLDAFDELSVQSFLQDMELSNSDWVDIKTPYAEVHVPKSYMRTSFAQQDGDKANGYTPEDVQAYVDDLNNYLIAGNYAFAGFSGAGLPALSDEVRQFCDMQGLSNALYDGNDTNLCADSKIHLKPKIQHINADAAASCGALCSGNPFDSGSPIMPLDWGENHEMGHNLQRGRLNIYSSRSGETSNNIFPLHTQWAWTVAQGLSKHPSQTRPSHQEAFNQLQAAIAAGTAANSNHPMWFDGSDIYANGGARLSFYIQLAYSQQSWEVYTKLYLMERIFSDAIKTDAKWAAAKDLLGFGSYTRTEAAAINTGNDFMYVAASKIAGKDYSNYFSAWGIEVSTKAKAQVAANGFVEQVPALFYYVHKELPAVMPSALDAIPLDGVRAWVDPTP
ncbi:ImpA family metalloprotease [Candidatus Thiothrix anitrata]|uniref:ImpA family metalloprotease n=1 Tax=Candidatus Thiothrix anitrata TaxID=2823902 RepID=A0ABX7WYY2_9GAMM|nr:ImpA family metalloprotease [Candidatus Thiothrix anitrata]QTR48850.1 ImpA family metalloprotease [Candidatus Thiothrix anitrata]